MTDNDKLDAAAPNSGAQAAEQADAYKGVFAPRHLRFDDGSTMTIPPHPSLRMFDEERLAAYDELLFEVESYDRGPDLFIPEQKSTDRNGNEIVLPPETKKGPVLTPHRKKGKLITPPWEARVVIAVLGQQKYDLLRSKTIDGERAGAADVWRAWSEQRVDISERQRTDSKSG